MKSIGNHPQEQQVLDDIAQYGWHCVHIQREGEWVPYSFTIGLFHNYRHPEFIIFGLSGNIAHRLLTIAVDAIQAGKPIDLDASTDALLNAYLCCFVNVPKTQYAEHVGFCEWYYDGDDFPLVQIVWPSPNGQFPWHPAVSPAFRKAQPVIADAPHTN